MTYDGWSMETTAQTPAFAVVDSPTGTGQIMADTRENRPESLPAPAVPQPAPVAPAAPVQPAPTAFEHAVAAEPAAKWLDVAGRRYRAVDALSARSMAKALDTIARFQSDVSAAGDQNVGAVAVVFNDVIDLAFRMVDPGEEQRLDADLDDKANPIPLADLLNGVVALFPLYTGASAPKPQPS